MSDPFNPPPALTYQEECEQRSEIDGERSRLDPARAEAEAHAAGIRTDFSDFEPSRVPSSPGRQGGGVGQAPPPDSSWPGGDSMPPSGPEAEVEAA